MNDEATPQGVSADPAATPPAPATPQAPVNPRDAVLDKMDQQIEESRQQEQRDYLSENAEELGMAPPPPEPDPNADGALATSPMHPPAEPVPASPPVIPEGYEDMSQYIVMHNGEPHMKAKVNGIDKLIPMARVQQQAQKLDAADVSLQHANQLTRDLAQREEYVRQNEANLKTKMETLTTPVPPSDVPGDETLLSEAQDIVHTLFKGKEEDSAAKLADLIKRSRVPVTTAPPIDTTLIAAEAAQVAKALMTEEELQKDAVTGLDKFQIDYPGIMADPNLYNMADKMTESIEREHPDWKPSQLMMEAGKRTTEWLAKQKGTVINPDPGNLPPEPPADQDPNRQAGKDNLVRIPAPALGAVSPSGVVEEAVQTPHEALAEIRESRGQP